MEKVVFFPLSTPHSNINKVSFSICNKNNIHSFKTVMLLKGQKDKNTSFTYLCKVFSLSLSLDWQILLHFRRVAVQFFENCDQIFISQLAKILIISFSGTSTHSSDNSPPINTTQLTYGPNKTAITNRQTLIGGIQIIGLDDTILRWSWTLLCYKWI